MSHLSERPEHAVVGAALPHESAALHVTGRALYTDDLHPRTKDVLHAWPVQTDRARARVTRLEVAKAYDVPGVEMTHDGDLCSFDAFLKKYELTDPALLQLAVIVRGADTSRLDLAPQSAGLFALSLGLSKTFSNDHEMLGHGMVMYDALYAWCKSCQAETHNWPPGMVA